MTLSEKQIEFSKLLELLCEDRMTAADAQRLEELARGDKQLLRLYIDYIDLHGSLVWNTAEAGSGAHAVVPQIECDFSEDRIPPKIQATPRQPGSSRRRAPRGLRRMASWVIAPALLIAAFVAWQTLTPDEHRSGNIVEVGPPAPTPKSVEDRDSTPEADVPPFVEEVAIHAADSMQSPQRDVPLPRDDRSVAQIPDVGRVGVTIADLTEAQPRPAVVPDDAVVANIDRRVRDVWSDYEVTPSKLATELEWLRRVYLDTVGHIPTSRTAESFAASRNSDKRQTVVNDLLDDSDFIRNWSTIWANLLVGRTARAAVDRPALVSFLQDSFAENRPWDDIVADLISAEGTPRENGAASFLIAHLNNQAVPATAITSRLFLGTQVQCTQCHNHPFNDLTQAQFWTFNSIFKQTKVERTSRMKNDGTEVVTARLMSRSLGGPTYYEKLSGLMQTAYPEFDGTAIAAHAEVDRREVLAKLLSRGKQPQLARAMVNRMWAHFFGYGFTRPIDDMGPHNPPTHPELLSELTKAFVASNYDIRQLVRWIVSSEAYQLSSRFNASNAEDNPDIGHLPLFSRMYVKPMTAEQVYDSLLVANEAHRAAGFDWQQSSEFRGRWIQQFVFAHDTEENDESSNFDGTVTQALMMMNGKLTDAETVNRRGTFLDRLIKDDASFAEKIRAICLATLSREPTRNELSTFRRLIGRSSNVPDLLKDVYWAYLNSSEFVMVY